MKKVKFKKTDLLYVLFVVLLIVSIIVIVLIKVPVKYQIRKEVQCLQYDSSGNCKDISINIDGYYYDYILKINGTGNNPDTYRGLFYIPDIPETNDKYSISFSFSDSYTDKNLKDGRMYYPDDKNFDIYIYNMDSKMNNFELDVKYNGEEYKIVTKNN